MSDISTGGGVQHITKMTDKIATLQKALQQISDAKRQLCRNTAEAKSRIQCNISRQLETLRNREVWLLNQLDLVSSAKEEVLQQQSAKLNQTLGVLQNSVQYPGATGDSIAKLELGDISPAETPYVSFKSDPNSLRDAIMNYGRIDPNSVPPLQSPFMAPNHPAPSLPKQFEDYNDAEHHILYKTVEEINRSKTSEPCVQVNIPKLSPKIEDWLLYPPSGASVNSDPRFTFPKLSNNLSDWLRAPIKVPAKPTSSPLVTPLKRDTLPPFEGISTDASIKTWLHKIKQCPYEEEEDDYDFVEEMSDTRTQASVETLEQFMDDQEEKWLKRSDMLYTEDTPQVTFKIASLPMENWLLKSDRPSYQGDGPSVIDMSRYLKKVTEELDQWLLNRATGKPVDDSGIDSESSIIERLRPPVPSSLKLEWTLEGPVSAADNPWLQKSRTSVKSSHSVSPISSRSSSFSSLSSNPNISNKWLLKGGNPEDTLPTSISCPFMEKYKKDMADATWLKCDIKSSTPKSVNPLASFESENSDTSRWLNPRKFTEEPLSEGASPLKKVLDFQKSSGESVWILKPSEKVKIPNPISFDKLFEKGGNQWLLQPVVSLEEELLEEDLC